MHTCMHTRVGRMNDKTNLKEALGALSATTKAGKLRGLMPDIERKLSEGVRVEAIIEALKKGGLEIPLSTFRSYLYRHRQKTGKKPPASIAPVETGESSGAEADFEQQPRMTNKGDFKAARKKEIDLNELAEFGRTKE